MKKLSGRELALQAAKIRRSALEAVQAAHSGHLGGSLSAADVMTVLYFDRMRIDPEHPDDGERDRFVLSKGHATPALYAALAHRGYFPLEELKTFRSIEGRLSGHAEMTQIPGVDMSTGSLGQGLSAGVGMALMGKLEKKSWHVYVMTGDGELQEGQIWEAAMAAANYNLDHLILIVDNNNLQIDGEIGKVMSPYPLDEKFRAFGWNVFCVDGHDCEALRGVLKQAEETQGKPSVILARTVKGKGVSYMEDQAGWHGKTPDEEQFRIAFEEIDRRIQILEEQIWEI